ncbi:hypothetical protein LTR95_012038 [Oleoguttula sp. CCFEE 5521]
MNLDGPAFEADNIEDLAVLRHRKRENARTPAETLIDRAEFRKILNRIFRTVLSPKSSGADAASEEMEKQEARESHRRDAAYSSIIGRHPLMPAAAVNPGAEPTHTARPELPEINPTTLSEEDSEGASAPAADVVIEHDADLSPGQEPKRWNADVELARARLADQIATYKVKHGLKQDHISAEHERASILAQLHEAQYHGDEPSSAVIEAASKPTSTLDANFYIVDEDPVNGGHKIVDTQRVVIGYEQQSEQDAEGAVVEAESHASASGTHLPQANGANGQIDAAIEAARKAGILARKEAIEKEWKKRGWPTSDRTLMMLAQADTITEEQERRDEVALSEARAAGRSAPTSKPIILRFAKDTMSGERRLVGWRDGQRIEPPLERAARVDERVDSLRAEAMAEKSKESMQIAMPRAKRWSGRVSVPQGDWCPERLGLTPDDDASICAQMKWIENEQHRRDNYSISVAEAADLPIPEFPQILYGFGKNQTNSSHHVVGWRHDERIRTQVELTAQCVDPQTAQNVSANATAFLSADRTMGQPAAFVVAITMLTFLAYGFLNGLLNDVVKRRKQAKETKRLVAQKEKIETLLRANKAQISLEKAKFLLQATGHATPEMKAKEQLAATMAPAPGVSDRETIVMLINELLGFDYVRATRLLARSLMARRDVQHMGATFCGLVFIGSGHMAVRYAKSGNMTADVMCAFWKLKDFVCHPLFIILSAALGLCFADADLVAWLDDREKNRLATAEEAKTVLSALAVADAKPVDPSYYTDCNESCCESDDESEDEEDVNYGEDATRNASNATLVDEQASDTDDEKPTASPPPCGHVHLIDFLQTENDQQRSINTRYRTQLKNVTRLHNEQVKVISEAKLLLDDFAKRHELCQREVTSAKEDLHNARNEVERLKASLEGQVRVQRSLILQREWANDALAGAKKENFHLTENSKAQIASWKMQARTCYEKGLKWETEGVALGKKIEEINAMMDNKLKTAHDINEKTFASMDRLQTEVTRLKTELAAKTNEFERADRLLLAQEKRSLEIIGSLKSDIMRLKAKTSSQVQCSGSYRAEIDCLNQNNTELRAEIESLKGEVVSQEQNTATDKSQIASLAQYNEALKSAYTKRTTELTSAHTQETDKLNATVTDWHAKLHTAWKREAELNSIVEREHGLRREAQETMWALQRVLSAKEGEAAEMLREDADGVELKGGEHEETDVSDVISEAESGSEFSVLSAPREDAESEAEEA